MNFQIMFTKILTLFSLIPLLLILLELKTTSMTSLSFNFRRRSHVACFTGDYSKYVPRKGWRKECFKTNPEGMVRYMISCVTSSPEKSKIEYGPLTKTGHPSTITFVTALTALSDANSVKYSQNASVFVEATDFIHQYYIRIQTPDFKSPDCYKLVTNNDPMLVLERDKKRN